jgi:hypothetical protein
VGAVPAAPVEAAQRAEQALARRDAAGWITGSYVDHLHSARLNLDFQLDALHREWHEPDGVEDTAAKFIVAFREVSCHKKIGGMSLHSWIGMCRQYRSGRPFLMYLSDRSQMSSEVPA